MSQPANDEFSQHLSDDEESNHEDASDTGAAPKQQQQVIPQTTAISNIKLPILKKEEYDIWAMEMEHYLEYIDNDVWKVIQNGNSKKRISTGKDGIVRILSPVTAAEIQAVEKERKAKNILLMAIPKEHMRRFHGMDDAKEIWEAIRTRFGGNANSKKMQKAVFKQQFEAFKISSSEGLEKGYDRFQQLLSQLEAHGAEVSTEDANHKFLRSLPPAWSNLAMTMRTKPDVDTLSIDDLYNNLRVFEQEIQGASKTSSSAQNVAFVSQSKSSTNKVKSGFTGAYSTCTPSTSSTNIPEKEVLAGFADEVIYSLFAKQSEDWDLLHEDLEQIDDLDIEEMDINWQIAMIAIRMKKFYKKTGRRVRVDGKTPVGFDKKKLECFNCHNTGHFARECTAKGTHDGKKKRDSIYQHQEAGKQEKNQMGLLTMDDGIVNWGEHTEVEETNHALMAISSSNEANEIYEKDEKLKRYRRIGMKAVKEKEQLHKTLDSWKDSSKNLWRLINSGMSSNSKVGLGFEIQSNNKVLSYEEEMNFYVFNCSKEDTVRKPLYSRFTKTNDFKGVPHPLSGDYTPTPQDEIDESLYVYGKKGPQEPEPNVSDDRSSEYSTCQSNDKVYVSTPITSNEKGVSDPKSKEVEPSCVSHIKTPRQPIKDQATPKVNRKNWNAMMERELGEGYSFTKKKCFVCGSVSHLIKDCDYYEKKMAREAEVKKQRVVNSGNGVAKPVWTNANRVNHANKLVPRSVQINAGRPNINTVRPNIDTNRTNIHSVRPNINTVRPRVNTGHLTEEHGEIEVYLIVDALGHMRQHKVLFTETECLVVSSDFKMPDENQILLKVPRHHNMYSFDMKTPSPAKGFACLIAKATSDESKLWHKRIEDVHEFCGETREFKIRVQQCQNSTTEWVLNERMNRTLIEAARTMLADSLLPTTFWAEAVSTACYIFNRKSQCQGVGASEVTNSIGTSQTPSFNVSEEKDEEVELIVVPSTMRNTEEIAESRKSSTNSKKEEILTELQQAKKASSIDTSEDNPKILAFRRELEEIALKHLGKVSKKHHLQAQNLSDKSETGFLMRHLYDEEGVSHARGVVTIQAATSMGSCRLPQDMKEEGIDMLRFLAPVVRIESISRITEKDEVAVDVVTPKTSNLNAENPHRWLSISGNGLISWQCQESVIEATSTTVVEYVVVDKLLGQVLWVLINYGLWFQFHEISKIHIDNESNNLHCEEPMYHSRQSTMSFLGLDILAGIAGFAICKAGVIKGYKTFVPAMLIVTNPNCWSKKSDVAQTSTTSSTILVPSTSLPPEQSLPPIPTPIPASTPTPIPETDPESMEHTDKEPSLAHQHFSPPQEHAHEQNLVKKVKKLEGILKRKNMVFSDSEEEEPEDQGRKSQDDPLVSLAEEYKRMKETKGKKVVTSLDFQEEVNIGAEGVNTAEGKRSIPSPDKGQREGKASMIIEEAPKKTKEQILQEEASLAEAIRLILWWKERRAQHYTDEDWDLIRAKIEANAELSKSVLGSDLQGEDFAKKMVELVNQRKKHFAEERARAKRNKPMTQSQLRTYMMNYLKNQGTWKLSQLKNLSFEEVKEEFDKLVKQVESFAPINFEATKDSLKRFGEELQTKTSKRLKSDEAKDDEPTKKTRKRRKHMARKGLHTDLDKDDSKDTDEASEQDDSASGTKIPINHVHCAMKSPSIATYKIIKYGMNGLEDGLENVLWEYLKNMFEEPLSTDPIWSLLGQQRIISWRYYDTYRVHYLNLESMDIYMLIERQYPLSAEVCKAMLDKKLQGGNQMRIATNYADAPPPPPPPPPPSQTPTQQTPHTVSTIKLPILKKGEYDI
ncbi:putative ribonuclease H-like domain-containing protein [Tanacetum coccineum]